MPVVLEKLYNLKIPTAHNSGLIFLSASETAGPIWEIDNFFTEHGWKFYFWIFRSWNHWRLKI